MLLGNFMTIQRAITIANLAFIALGAYFTVGLFYQVVGLEFQPSKPAVAEKTSMSGSRRVARKPYGSYRPIHQRDLFKTIKTPVTPIQKSNVDLENLEDTKLQLKLWGTVTGNTEKSYAVIENTKKREQNLFRVGDSIENATVKLILRSKVVLSVNGKDEVLAMEEVTSSKSRSRVVAGGSRIRPRTGGGVRKQRVSLRRSMINNAIQDVSKLMTQVKITPKLGEDGRQEGLSMSNIKPNSIFRRMGLRNGDVLKSVDGQEIQSVDDALKLYENLRSADAVSVQIQRRGTERTIEYNIR
jgi:general secretion pathway protein C